ncbi:MAG TPA: glycosyltransferase family 2 protein [Sphingobacteriaceae bacterium]|nr:glycosyltransferase family 2 protein [Sphingobacteriaceae bacterium]
MNNITSTLIISTYNWPAALDICLYSVQNQAVLPGEIIIADDGSGDETKSVIEKHQDLFKIPIKHIWHEDKGFRKSVILNKALIKSTNQYIIQIDGDVILDKNFVSDHLANAEHNTFIRGTRAMLSEHKTKKVIIERNITLSPFESGVGNWNNALRIPVLQWLGTRKEKSSRSVRGSNLSYWKDDFIRVNGYNNDLIGWGHEDEELAARFINNGNVKKIIKLSAVQYHLYHQGSSKNNEIDHALEVNRVINEGIKICKNGYSSTDD